MDSISHLPTDLQSKFKVVNEGETIETLSHLWNKLEDNNSENRVLLICGSFRLMVDVNSFFNLEYEVDPIDTNEKNGLLTKNGESVAVKW
jgi:hypothetical protein